MQLQLTPHHSILYHSAVLDIFQPFVSTPEILLLSSSSVPRGSVGDVIRASTNQLKRLLLLCRFQNPRTFSLIVVNAALVHVTNAMVSDSARATEMTSLSDPGRAERGKLKRAWDPDWRFYLHLSLANCQKASECYPMFKSVCRGLLTMVLRSGAINSTEARALRRKFEMSGEQGSLPKTDLGVWTLDVGLAEVAPADAQVAALAQELDAMVSFDEYTTGGDLVLGADEVIGNTQNPDSPFDLS